MKNRTSQLRWSRLCVLVFALCCMYTTLAFANVTAQQQTPTADRITLKSVANDKTPELPNAVFSHDKHTKALADKDCSTCHNPVKDSEGTYSFTFKGAEGIAAHSLKDHYHDNCITCHEQRAKNRETTGPLTADCRTCHNGSLSSTNPDWYEINFSKILHNQHVTSNAIPAQAGQETNCSTCHNTYSAENKRIPYVKNTEESCRSCHLTDAAHAKATLANPEKELLLPLGKISHSLCVTCHVQTQKANPTAKVGPIDCTGCHGVARYEADKLLTSDKEILKSIPRLNRGQADAMLIEPTSSRTQKPEGGMSLVSFNHKLHETVTADCRSCHHKRIEACSTCHSVEGKQEGDFVNLYTAMHSENNTRSCVGCHNQEKTRPECASCHASVKNTLSINNCATCHNMNDPETQQVLTAKLAASYTKEEKQLMAHSQVAVREAKQPLLMPLSDVPETVTLGILANEYEPAQVPHRKIVKALAQKAAGNSLATTFHSVDTTLCMSCHHNSPASATPPQCVSCHSIDASTETAGKPGLKAAYHLQCMSCHAQLNQKPLATDCSGCHKPRTR